VRDAGPRGQGGAGALLPPHVLERLGGLEFVARRVVEGFVAGAHRSPYRGAGEEFARHRAYQQGDDVRRIDWRLFARSDRLFVREYREDSNVHAWIVVDATASMGYTDAMGVSKLRCASFVAAALAHLMLRAGDAVGLASVGEGARLHLPPRNRPGQLHDVLLELEKLRAGGSTPVAEAMDATSGRLRRRGRMVVLSDLLTDDEGAALLAAAGRIHARGSELSVLRVLTPEELGRAPLPDASFFDPERPSRPIAGRPADDSAYRARLEAYYARLRLGLRESGAEYVEVDTAEPVERALAAWLAPR
jgi:uncharacterized protein (DUF58 family)